MKLNLNILDRILQIRFFKIPKTPVVGYTSLTYDGKHCLFLDYDLVNPEIVYYDLNLLFKKKLISHAYIFTTYQEKDALGEVGNYHVICLDKFMFYEILELMNMTHCDNLHKNLAKKTRYRSWVLRFTRKGKRGNPVFLKFLSGEENKTEQSFAHYKLINLLYDNIDNRKFNFKFDKIDKAILTFYNTNSKLEEKQIK